MDGLPLRPHEPMPYFSALHRNNVPLDRLHGEAGAWLTYALTQAPKRAPTVMGHSIISWHKLA